MSDNFVIREFGNIHKNNKENQKIQESDIDNIYINEDAWQYLAKYAESSNKEDRFLKFYNSTTLKVQNFVGVITTPDGTQIEILPKTDITVNTESVENSREKLVKMLKVVHNLPLLQSTQADLQLKHTPLLDILISWFLAEVDKIIKKGLRKDYIQVQNQAKFLKGSLRTHKQLNEPPHKQHLFHIKYNVFSNNRAENRLIHSALRQVLRWSKDNHNQILIKHFLALFDEVELSTNYNTDFDNWSNAKDMQYYQNSLPWLKLILNQQSPFTLKDNNKGISFLIPMEKLFEKFVAKILAKDLPKNYSLQEQISSKYLSIDPKAFLLKPDIGVYRKDKLKYILDTKWKLIDENTIDNKKEISQGDIYQLYAYGKKYGVKKVMLIYPKWSKFNSSLNFKLDENLELKVCSFELP